ncbi:hypothetical protein AJ80_00548 [Polytolypa hystricis UAMH7299]|uniref:Pisatin demethylase n=1 Tax=Polytolypa hystricis (strain UAMH7299) TaxID=1447883 RepID=A0A2B7Z2Y3_POLH7|nr:hypothetical protein AJ80_00548 [Polytolypa hystricis UAMH7299]
MAGPYLLQLLGNMFVSLPFLVVFLAAIAGWFAVRSYYRLRQFKGPWLGSFSKLWMVRSTYHGRMHLDVAEVCQKYGNLARIGPNDLITNDPDILRRINGVRSPYTRSDWYNATAFDHKLSHVFCERDETRHVEMRNKLVPGYSGKENEHLEATIDHEFLSLFRLIRQKYTSTATDFRPVDFARLCQFFTLDVISAVAFGEPMGFVAKDEDVHGYIANQVAMLPVFEWLSTLPILEKMLRIPFIAKFAMPSPEDKNGAGLLMGVARKMVAERFGPNKKTKKDMLGSFLSHGVTRAEAEQETVLQIFAGSDTTATTIRTTVLFLITQPLALVKLQNELDQAEREGRLSRPILTYEEAKSLPYLQACVKEGLRIWPPVMGLMQKVVPPEGDTLDGRFVPGGTNIGYCAWGVHRRPETFGHDAEIFRPDRWLEGDPEGEKLQAMNRTHDLVFGSGRYACLGKPVAMIEVSKAIAEIFRRFDITIVDPSDPWQTVGRNGLFLQQELDVRISERSSGKA